MPELPEVETVRRALVTMIAGKTITRVTVLYPRIISPSVDVPDEKTFCAKLAGARVTDVHRRGKHLLFILDRAVLVSHLRMEGCYYLTPSAEAVEKHEHVLFTLDDQTDLRYRDVRKFGRMTLVIGDEARALSLPPLSSLGLEPLSASMTGKTLHRAFSRTARPVKEVLLDQTVIAGIGNIYASESLHHAGISPLRDASSLSEEECARLTEAIKTTLEHAIAAGGSTIRTFRSPLDVHGSFQEEFAVYHQTTCPACGGEITRVMLGGRSTFYCPRCQK